MKPEDLAKMPDDQLALMVAVGHQADRAFAEIASRYRWLLRTLAARYWVAGADRADVEQEALLGLEKACRDYRGGMGATFSSFAHVACERQVITAVKTATRRKHELLNAATSLDAPAPGGDVDDALLRDIVGDDDLGPHEQLELAEAMRTLASLPGRLSGLEHQALSGRLNGRSYAQIAADLDVDEKAIDNALGRAASKARALLGEVIP